MEVSDLVKRAIERREWSKSGLAREIGCDVRTISRLVASGRIGPTYARKLRDLLDTKAGPLTDDECRRIRSMVAWFEENAARLGPVPNPSRPTPTRLTPVHFAPENKRAKTKKGPDASGPARSRNRQ